MSPLNYYQIYDDDEFDEDELNDEWSDDDELIELYERLCQEKIKLESQLREVENNLEDVEAQLRRMRGYGGG
ncbi:MAG: hypothetical protein ABI417_07360 [Coleofasciculaceae cyanobacterium]